MSLKNFSSTYLLNKKHSLKDQNQNEYNIVGLILHDVNVLQKGILSVRFKRNDTNIKIYGLAQLAVSRSKQNNDKRLLILSSVNFLDTKIELTLYYPLFCFI